MMRSPEEGGPKRGTGKNISIGNLGKEKKEKRERRVEQRGGEGEKFKKINPYHQTGGGRRKKKRT